MRIFMNALANETGAETLKNLRAPEFIIPTLVMPVAFYSLFGIVLANAKEQASYLLATFGIFSVMGPAIFGFGAGVATERERGWLRLKRAVPSPALTYIFAKLYAALFFSLAALIIMYLVAGFAGGVSLPKERWALLLFVHLSSSLPFVFIGLSLGFIFSTNGAVAIANIVFLALAALGGLWIPVFLMPQFLKNFANWLPSYHLGEIALRVIKPGPLDFSGSHLPTILIMTSILALIALFCWIRQRN